MLSGWVNKGWKKVIQVEDTREKIVCSGHNVDIDLPVSSIELMIAVYSFCLIAWPGQFD